jgi:hypothetical protein
MTKPLSLIRAAGLAGLALGAASVSAETYPAANFKPSVIYLAPDFAAHTSGGAATATVAAAADPAFPAAYFQPKVIFLAPDWATHSSTAAAQPAYDPAYPAAYFEPKVIHPAK